MIVLCGVKQTTHPVWGTFTEPDLPACGPGDGYEVVSCDTLKDFCLVKVTGPTLPGEVKKSAGCCVLYEDGKGGEPLKAADFTALSTFLTEKGIPAKDLAAAMGAGLETGAIKAGRLIDFLKNQPKE